MKKNLDELLRMNLQMFADNPDGGEDGGQDSGQEGTEGEEKDVFDRSEVDRKISKAVESALNKQREKFEREKQAEIEKAKKDAEQYSKLSEREKLEKQLEEREKQIEARERELNNAKLQSDIEADLKENSLPVAFAELLVSLEDPEEIKKAVNNIKKTFDEAVHEQVKVKLRQDSPEEGSGISVQKPDGGGIEEFARKNRLIKN